MTPKVGDTVKCNCGCDGSPFVVATIEGDRAESADGMRSAYVSKCDVVTRPPKAKMKPAPLPRAVRELLRDAGRREGGGQVSVEPWMVAVCAEASAGAPAAPAWSESAPGVPLCDESCAHHDGKRCRLTGFRPGPICEPVVGAMAAMLTASASR